MVIPLYISKLLAVYSAIVTMLLFMFIYDTGTRNTQIIQRTSITCQCEQKSNTNDAFQKPRNYSVISASVPNYPNDTNFFYRGKAFETNRAWGYLYLLPFTALAWRRVGFETITVITVDFENIQPEAYRLLRIVEETLKQVGATIIYFDVPSHMKVRLGQVLRLAPAVLDQFNDHDYIITGDADLWPINTPQYHVPFGKTMMLTMTGCCGWFNYSGSQYQMFPLSHMEMTVKLWRRIFGKDIQMKPKNQSLIRYKEIGHFLKVLGDYTEGQDINGPARHGGKLWYLDQFYATVKITDYVKKVDNSSHHFYKAFLGCTRIATGNWDKRVNLTSDCIVDAHVFKSWPWNRDSWRRMRVLAHRLFTSEMFDMISVYRDTFKAVYDGKL